MDPITINLIIGLVAQLIGEEPAIAADLRKLFASGNPTPADFEALKASVAAQTYGQFVPASQLGGAQTGS